VKLILSHGESREFEPFDRFAQLETSKGRTLDILLDEFAAIRAKNLRELESLGIGIGELDLRGRHPDLGTVTLRQLLSTWVAHDLDHVMQISRVVGRQYAQAVGPWRSYLRIMNAIDH
jgi:hypothetical protein